MKTIKTFDKRGWKNLPDIVLIKGNTKVHLKKWCKNGWQKNDEDAGNENDGMESCDESGILKKYE